MKKKIIDLTLDEIKKICEKHKWCEGCPFDNPAMENICLRQFIELAGCISVKELLSEEVEVNER